MLSRLISVRDRVAIVRGQGGLGDIFMHRMIFGGMKSLHPGVHITFACPKEYHPAVSDHPHIDHLTTPDKIKPEDFVSVYETTRICYRYEYEHSPYIYKHRADIWAEEGCGFQIARHDMEFHFSEEELARGRAAIGEGPVALISPVTAMGSKNLNPKQMKPVAEKLTNLGFKVWYTHTKDLPEYGATLHGLDIRTFMAAVSQANIVIAADTGTFHLAGGLKRPLVAIFGWADGKVYGKYYETMTLVQRHREDDPSWCGPCFNFYRCPKAEFTDVVKPCISGWTADELWAATKECLKKYPEQMAT